MSEKLKPARTPDPDLNEILAELVAREPIFHRPEFGTRRDDFEAMMMPDFWEIGASGRRYSREYVLQTLEIRHSTPQQDVWETSDFCCQQLAEDIFLLTYTLLQNKERRTRRTTIWHRTLEGWKIVFHQGTIMEKESSVA